MYMKVFPHGQGGGDGPTRYLVRQDYPGRDANPPKILRGDGETTRDLIDSLDTKWKFTAGVLSWHPDDTVTPEQEQRIMDDFEQVAFAGLEPDQRNILWVRHVHADHHELHFVIPRVELSSGKAFNPCPPGWQKHFDVFRDLHNHREGWARPDDPARARLHTPEHADLHNARLLRWGKTPSKDERAEAKEAIHVFMQENIKQGVVQNRAEVLQALTESGLEINRAGKDYITVKDPDSGEKLRLKGGIYAEHWKPELVGRTPKSKDRAGTTGDGSSDPATVRRLEQELERIVTNRAQYNRGRYPGPACELGEERGFALPDSERRLWLEMPASSEHNDVHIDGSDVQRMGVDYLGRGQDNETAPGNNHAIGAERDAGNGKFSVLGHIQGVGTVQMGRQGLSADAGRLDNKSLGNGQKPGHLENSEEISHDRTGAHSQKYFACIGAGVDDHAGNPRQTSGRPANTPGSTGPIPSGTTPENTTTPDCATGISAALATLERYTRELGTALVAYERLVERQIALVRDRQWSPGPRLG